MTVRQKEASWILRRPFPAWNSRRRPNRTKKNERCPTDAKNQPVHGVRCRPRGIVCAAAGPLSIADRTSFDRFPPALLAFLLMLLIASLLDAVLTIRLIEAGSGEVNPVMNRLLEHGVLAFLLGKYLLTVIGLPVLLIFKNHYLFGTRIRVGYLIPFLVALYAVLIGYQCVLMQRCPGW